MADLDPCEGSASLYLTLRPPASSPQRHRTRSSLAAAALSLAPTWRRTACYDLSSFSLLSSARLVITVGDKFADTCRCQAGVIMLLPGRRSSL
eukprot:1124368-Pleurochrysis_carterae.AAC.1